MEYPPGQEVTQTSSNMQPNDLCPIAMTDESNVEQSLGTQSALNLSQHRASQSPLSQDDTCDMGFSSAMETAPRHLHFQGKADLAPSLVLQCELTKY